MGSRNDSKRSFQSINPSVYVYTRFNFHFCVLTLHLGHKATKYSVKAITEVPLQGSGGEVTDATNPSVADHMNLTVYF